jgi:hypothetical protein
MPKIARTIATGAMLSVMSLGMATAAQAGPPDQIELFRQGERAAQQPADPVQQFRSGERAAQQPAVDPVQEFRRGERASQQPAVDPVQEFRRGERASPPTATAQPAPEPDRPVALVGLLAAALALLVAVTALTVRRAGRRLRVGQAA